VVPPDPSGLASRAVGARSVDTTMGFKPLKGLVMATRSGTVDPGLIVWLLQHGRLGLDEVTAGLEQSAGLAGLSGVLGGDVRDVQRAAAAGDPAAWLAMNGRDVLVFTG
jgi:acetate kinase